VIDTNSLEFLIGKRIGSLLMSYLIVRLVIKGRKLILKWGQAFLIVSPVN